MLVGRTRGMDTLARLASALPAPGRLTSLRSMSRKRVHSPRTPSAPTRPVRRPRPACSVAQRLRGTFQPRSRPTRVSDEGASGLPSSVPPAPRPRNRLPDHDSTQSADRMAMRGEGRPAARPGSVGAEGGKGWRTCFCDTERRLVNRLAAGKVLASRRSTFSSPFHPASIQPPRRPGRAKLTSNGLAGFVLATTLLRRVRGWKVGRRASATLSAGSSTAPPSAKPSPVAEARLPTFHPANTPRPTRSLPSTTAAAQRSKARLAAATASIADQASRPGKRSM